MTLRDCPECGHRVSESATDCPNCGYPFNETIAHAEQVPLLESRGGERPLLPVLALLASSFLAPITLVAAILMREWPKPFRQAIAISSCVFLMLYVVVAEQNAPLNRAGSDTAPPPSQHVTVIAPPVTQPKLSPALTPDQVRIRNLEGVAREVFGRAEADRRRLGDLIESGKWEELRTAARDMRTRLAQDRKRIAALPATGRLREARNYFVSAVDNYREYTSVMAGGRELILNDGFEAFDRRIARVKKNGVLNLTSGLLKLATSAIHHGVVDNSILDPDVVTGTWRWWGIDSFGD